MLSSSNLLVALIVGGSLIWPLTPRIHHWGRRACVPGASMPAGLALPPVQDPMIVGFERGFPPIEDCPVIPSSSISGIVVPGGALSSHHLNGRLIDDIHHASERVRTAAMFARRYPDAAIMASCGQAFDTGADRNAADGDEADARCRASSPP